MAQYQIGKLKHDKSHFFTLKNITHMHWLLRLYLLSNRNQTWEIHEIQGLRTLLDGFRRKSSRFTEFTGLRGTGLTTSLCRATLRAVLGEVNAPSVQGASIGTSQIYPGRQGRMILGLPMFTLESSRVISREHLGYSQCFQTLPPSFKDA